MVLPWTPPSCRKTVSSRQQCVPKHLADAIEQLTFSGSPFNYRQMKLSRAAFFRTNRTLFAVAMLCVLTLKGFSFLGMASSIAKHPEASNNYFSVVVLGGHCDQDRDNGLPHSGQAHHTECCVLCSGASRDQASADIVLLGAVIALLTPQTDPRPIPVSYSLLEPRLAFSTGLFSDWSATAPPSA